MNARFYSPTSGRFLTADTLIPSPTNPQSHNRYSYVLGNAVNLIDPSGHYPQNTSSYSYSGARLTSALDVIKQDAISRNSDNVSTLNNWQNGTAGAFASVGAGIGIVATAPEGVVTLGAASIVGGLVGAAIGGVIGYGVGTLIGNMVNSADSITNDVNFITNFISFNTRNTGSGELQVVINDDDGNSRWVSATSVNIVLQTDERRFAQDKYYVLIEFVLTDGRIARQSIEIHRSTMQYLDDLLSSSYPAGLTPWEYPPTPAPSN